MEEEKDTSWEERFDKEFPYTLVALNGNIDRTDKVKSFIRQEREALLKEIVAEVTKYKMEERNGVNMANEIFKDVERTLKGSEVKDTFPPLTAKEIVERCGNKVDGGKLLYDMDWYKNEAFFTTEKCRPISLDFTELQHKGKNWNECEKLGEMFNFAEVLYLLSTSEEFRKMLTDWNYTWTNSRSSLGLLVGVGYFDTDGASVNGGGPMDEFGRLGVSFSRGA